MFSFSASVRNFGTRVGEFFSRKKRDVNQEAENIENATEAHVQQAKDEVEKDIHNVSHNIGKKKLIINGSLFRKRLWRLYQTIFFNKFVRFIENILKYFFL